MSSRRRHHRPLSRRAALALVLAAGAASSLASSSRAPQAMSAAASERLLAFRGVTAPPAPSNARSDHLERFVDLGLIDVTGAATLLVTGAGRFSGSYPTNTAGLELILLPDEPAVIDAWRKDGVLLLEERLRLSARPHEKSYVELDAEPLILRHDRWRVFLRNATVRSLEVDLFLRAVE